MKNSIHFIIVFFLTTSCGNNPEPRQVNWQPYDETELIEQNKTHENPRMRFKLIQSRVTDLDETWKIIEKQLAGFTEADYHALSPLIYEKDIPAIQASIRSGALTYEKLTQWYLHRIAMYETDSTKTLHTVLYINPEAVELARQRDRLWKENEHPVYGMPILLKDNIGAEGMPTTAGAVAFMENRPDDAYIVDQLRKKGAIILGKVNLSEWAYLLGRGLPMGYSAIGGQTLNPYGRMDYHTGGSSSGSGTAMAANFAVGAIGTETSGSILSPSGNNAVVGLKPTVGLLSRSGIVPISYTLDTPGPMTRNVTDNAILLSAMTGEDPADKKTRGQDRGKEYWKQLEEASLKDKRFGIFREYMRDSLYKNAVSMLLEEGADTVSFTGNEMNFEGFLDLLVGEMRIGLENYIRDQASENLVFRKANDIVAFNLVDTFNRIPYGQALFEYMATASLSDDYLDSLRDRFHSEGVQYFLESMEGEDLDAVLSINNYNAGEAAMARFPCLIVPMGFQKDGEPKGLTFIGKPFQEQALLQMGYAFEQATHYRIPPKGYE